MYDFCFTLPTGYSRYLSQYIDFVLFFCNLQLRYIYFHNAQLLSAVCRLQKPAINLQGRSRKDHLHGGGQAKQELEDGTYIGEGT